MEPITIELPINPKDVFRLLALRTIVVQTDLIERLADKFDFKSGIDTTERLSWENDPFAYEHVGYTTQKPFAKMTERELCADTQAFFRQEPFGCIGRVIDYEIPLDNEKDSAYGKVDLLSVSGDTAYALEVKKFGSREHPLRALFEIYTFWRMLAKDGSHELFIERYKNGTRNLRGCKRVVPALLLDGASEICKRFDQIGVDSTGRLIRKFFSADIGMKVFAYDRELNVREVPVNF